MDTTPRSLHGSLRGFGRRSWLLVLVLCIGGLPSGAFSQAAPEADRASDFIPDAHESGQLRPIDPTVENVSGVDLETLSEGAAEAPSRGGDEASELCDRQTLGSTLRDNYSESEVKAVQRRLKELKFYKYLRHSTIVDGKVGIDTQCALMRYCRNRIPREAAELITELIDYPPDRFDLVYSVDPGTQELPESRSDDFKPIEEGLKRIEGREYLSSRQFEAAVREAVAGQLREGWTEEKIFEICPQSKQGSDDCDRIGPADSCAAALTAKYRNELSGMASDKDSVPDTPVHWRGCGSGCVIEREAARGVQDVLYGFYPFWGVGKPSEDAVAKGSAQTAMASDGGAKEGTAVTAPAFDILSRIGFFGFRLDDQGEIIGGDEKSSTEESFYDVAHRHGTRVDMVLYKHDWGWANEARDEENRKKIESFFWKARVSIRKRLQTRSSASLARILPFMTLGFSQRPFVWDGVTLYFANYPEKHAELFHSFIKDLHSDIREIDEDMNLNLMMSVGELGAGLYQYQDLCVLVRGKSFNPDEKGGTERDDLIGNESCSSQKDGDTDEDYVDLFIILLEEPTSDTKKELRREIEDNFKGMRRRNMLSKIVPVISPIGHASDSGQPYRQLYDDLIYFQWNFAGVGFWPLVTREQADFDELRIRIVDVFENRESLGLLGAMAAEHAPRLCDVACPNRWRVQFAFNVVVLSWVALWMFALSCSCGRAIKWLVWSLGLAALGVGLVSLICDPMWRAIDEYVLIGLLLTLVAWRLVSKIRKTQQSQQP